jgi:hypothetical protein
MRLREPVEYLYLVLMQRWMASAPPDGHQGQLDDGRIVRNSQISRFAFVIDKVSLGVENRVLPALEEYTRRKDGHSYVSRDSSWMEEPYPLRGGWHFEGCCNLEQKRGMLRLLRHAGLSDGFIACAGDFVEGLSVEKYVPTEEESENMIQRFRAREGSDGV